MKIPSTGSDMEAGPLLLDLGSISSVARAVPVLQTIPRATPTGRLFQKEVVKGSDKPGSLPHEMTSKTSTVPQLSTPPNGGGIKRSQSDKRRGGATKVMKREVRPPLKPEVEELQNKCTQLEERNKTLERRLAMFHDLFRSKERIINFIKFLESTP